MTDRRSIINAVQDSFRNSVPGGDTFPRSPDDFGPPEITAVSSSDGDTRSVRDLWDAEFNPGEGITGIYLPETNEMFVSNRGGGLHHTPLLRGILRLPPSERPSPIDRIVPWAANYAMDEWWVEVTQGGGSLIGALSEVGIDKDVELAVDGSSIQGDEVLWPVVWTLARLGIPDSGHIRYESQPTRSTSADPNYYQTDTYDLEPLYTELRFTPRGRPSALVDRSETVE